MWEKLKLIAVKEESNLNQLCKEGINYVIKKQASRYAHEKFWPSCPQNLFASRD